MATDARIGSELAGYRIEAPIGRGGMGDRLPRRAAAPGAQGRAQAAGARAGREPGLPRALRARVAPGGRARPPEHRAALRGRRGRRAAVHQHALRRGHRPARRCSSAMAGSSPSARSRSPPRSPARSTPPTAAASSTATSSPATSSSRADPGRRPARALLPDRLRPDEGHVLARRAHGHGHLRRHHRLHRPRADRGRQARRPRRPVRARLRALRVPDRPPALRARRGDQRHVGAPAGRAAHRHRRPPRPARRHRRRHRARAGQGPRAALRDVHGDGRGRPRRAAARRVIAPAAVTRAHASPVIARRT